MKKKEIYKPFAYSVKNTEVTVVEVKYARRRRKQLQMHHEKDILVIVSKIEIFIKRHIIFRN